MADHSTSTHPGIITPEAVPLDLPVAGIGSRGLAYLIDLVIITATLVALVLAATALGDPLAGAPGWLAVTLVLLLVFGVQLGYPVAFETMWRGRTPGKAAMGLRVVTVEGAPVGFRHAALRAALGLIDFQLTVGAAAMVTSLVNHRSQRLGDIVAGTLVLRERTGAGTATQRSFAPPPGLEELVARMDVAALGPAEYQAVRSLLLRLGTLQGDTRRRLTEQVASSLVGRVQPPPPRGLDAESWLRAVAAAYQARHRRASPAPPAGPGRTGTPVSAGPTSDDRYRPTGWEAVEARPDRREPRHGGGPVPNAAGGGADPAEADATGFTPPP